MQVNIPAANRPWLQGKSNFSAWHRSFKVYAKEYEDFYDYGYVERSEPQHPDHHLYCGKGEELDSDRVDELWCAHGETSAYKRYKYLETKYYEQQDCIRKARTMLWLSLSPTVQSLIGDRADSMEPHELHRAVRTLCQPCDQPDVKDQEGNTEEFEPGTRSEIKEAMHRVSLKNYASIAEMYEELENLNYQLDTGKGKKFDGATMKSLLICALSEYDSFVHAYEADLSRKHQHIEKIVADLQREEAKLKHDRKDDY